jgi:dTDP-4-amino-4,6-dideoxygalactose transaminase
MKTIPLSKVYLTDEIKQAVLKVMESGQYILTKECEAFEAELAQHTGTKHAVLSSNWTSAMTMVHQAMGLQRGDEILVPSHTAFPSIEPMCLWGATPVFIDIDDSYGMDVELLEAAVTPRTVGILPVHLYGHAVNLDRVFEVARKHRLWVIEDCAQAQGAKFKGRTVGSMGFCGAFSFFPSKNLTVMGDGGCICTNDDTLAERLRKLRNHGRIDKYRHDEIGYNHRFNEIQAAIGRVMLRHLDELNAHRRQVAARYNARLQGIVPTPPERSYSQSVYHMYVIRCGDQRDALQKFLHDRGINTGIHYPVANHQQPAITKLFPNLPPLPQTEKAVNEILSLPVYGELPLADVDYVCDNIAEFFGKK